MDSSSDAWATNDSAQRTIKEGEIVSLHAILRAIFDMEAKQ